MPALALNDSVFHSRAVRTRGFSIDNDPEPMVHQQFARLRFFERTLGCANLRTLDWGCGSGFNCRWLLDEGGASNVLGFDLSPDAITLAQQSYPEARFEVGDACSPKLCLEPGTWDRILSCEVLEHVPDMPAFLANIGRHLAPSGAALITTPNRMVFSLGHEPSPVNREHIKELTLDEFTQLLRPHFGHIEIHGQRFSDARLQDAWYTDVRRKIEACKAGTRWQTNPPLRETMRKWRLVDWAYQMPLLRSAWRAVRWELPRLLRRAVPTAPAYRWSDFEFVEADAPGVMWFCAIVRR